MRIISGKFKGRRISPPSTIAARPTTDFAKEGLFNLLNNRIDFNDIEVLELFAGTGGIGIEFVSRNAKSVTAVEISEKHVSFIRKTCVELKIDNLDLIKADVRNFLKSCSRKFDLIFADPPYDLNWLAEIPDAIFSKHLLTQDGLLILEHSVKNDFQNHPNFVEHRNYGNVNFSFFAM